MTEVFGFNNEIIEIVELPPPYDQISIRDVQVNEPPRYTLRTRISYCCKNIDINSPCVLKSLLVASFIVLGVTIYTIVREFN